MKIALKLEELAMTVIAIYCLTFYSLGISVWIWILLFFSPDLSMLGYLVNSKVGAVSYNLFHNKGTAITLVLIGWAGNMEALVSIGILLFAHSSFDRIWGYGLKYATDFKDTHLGSLAKPLQANVS